MADDQLHRRAFRAEVLKRALAFAEARLLDAFLRPNREEDPYNPHSSLSRRVVVALASDPVDPINPITPPSAP